MKNLLYHQSSIGNIAIVDNGEKITNVFFGKPGFLQTQFRNAETELNTLCAKQLDEYFKGVRRAFDLPMEMEGTPFQVNVWKAMLTVPYGETRTYRDIAKQIGNPNSYRAVGLANNKNPMVILIPCHRIVGTNGDMVGYGGGLAKKKQLLIFEREQLQKASK